MFDCFIEANCLSGLPAPGSNRRSALGWKKRSVNWQHVSVDRFVIAVRNYNIHEYNGIVRASNL